VLPPRRRCSYYLLLLLQLTLTRPLRYRDYWDGSKSMGFGPDRTDPVKAQAARRSASKAAVTSQRRAADALSQPKPPPELADLPELGSPGRLFSRVLGVL